jgi:hypothetical protein
MTAFEGAIHRRSLAECCINARVDVESRRELSQRGRSFHLWVEENGKPADFISVNPAFDAAGGR